MPTSATCPEVDEPRFGPKKWPAPGIPGAGWRETAAAGTFTPLAPDLPLCSRRHGVASVGPPLTYGQAPVSQPFGWKGRVRHSAGRVLRSAPAPVQDAIRRGSRRLLATLDRAPDQAAVWQSRPVPTPDGISFPELERTYGSWSVNGEPVGHLDTYWGEAICRFLYTWNMARDDSGSCLELGANPYFLTYLLDEHTKLDLSLANYYGDRGVKTETVSFVPPGATDRKQVEWHAQLFNIEEDVFPFEAGSFDVVLFCEMLEHLLMDPVAALRQIHRVLKPGGVLVLTTPNVARLENVLAMVSGANIYDPYSGFGPYGRHNREYSRHELHRLLGLCRIRRRVFLHRRWPPDRSHLVAGLRSGSTTRGFPGRRPGPIPVRPGPRHPAARR